MVLTLTLLGLCGVLMMGATTGGVILAFVRQVLTVMG
jgi:hypothetical protein